MVWYLPFKEPAAKYIDETYKAMGIPENQIFTLDLDIREGKKANDEGIRNIVYKKLWLDLLD